MLRFPDFMTMAQDGGKVVSLMHRPPFMTIGKGKAVPLQAWSGPEDSRMLRFPDFVTTTKDSNKGSQPYVPAAFTPRKYTWYSSLLEAESNPGP